MTMKDSPLLKIPHNILVRAVMKLTKGLYHSFVYQPGADSYLLRFDPNGVQDLVAFVPNEFVNAGSTYPHLLHILGILLDMDEKRVIAKLCKTAESITGREPLDKL